HPAVLPDSPVCLRQETYSLFQADRGRFPALDAEDGRLHPLPVVGLELVMAVDDELAPGALGGGGQHNGALPGADLFAEIRHALLVQRLARLRTDQAAISRVVVKQLSIGAGLV